MKTVKPRAIISLVAGVILMTGCATKSEIDVSTDYSMANFDQFTSYQWLPEGESKGHKPENNLITDRITGSINENLSSKGYHQADTKPDVFVDFSVTTAAKVNIDIIKLMKGMHPVLLGAEVMAHKPRNLKSESWKPVLSNILKVA